MIIDLPGGRQTFEYDCGAKALQLVMAYYGLDVREDELLAELKSHQNGTRVKLMRDVAKKYGFNVMVKTGFAVEEIKKFVDMKYPVIVLVQAWAERYMTLDDWRNDDDNGHYVIVVGYYDNIIVFEDPGTFGKTWLTQEEFEVRWHDVDPVTGERLDKFGLVLYGKKPAPAHKKIGHMD